MASRCSSRRLMLVIGVCLRCSPSSAIRKKVSSSVNLIHRTPDVSDEPTSTRRRDVEDRGSPFSPRKGVGFDVPERERDRPNKIKRQNTDFHGRGAHVPRGRSDFPGRQPTRTGTRRNGVRRGRSVRYPEYDADAVKRTESVGGAKSYHGRDLAVKRTKSLYRAGSLSRFKASCFGRCGGEYDPTKSCQCTAECHKHKNCCWNYQKRCLKKTVDEDNDTYRVLSYNICWGCMEGDLADSTAMKKDLRRVCSQFTGAAGVQGENGMGLNVTRCAMNTGEAIARYHIDAGGYDLMAFQEASNFGDLQLSRRGVMMEKVVHGVPLEFTHVKGIHEGQHKKAWIVSAYDQLRMGYHDDAIEGVLESDSGRPYLILIFDDKKLIFINIHNTQPGHWLFRRRSWKNFPEEIGKSLKDAFADDKQRRSYRVILAGDLNDLDGKLPGSLILPWNNAKLHNQQPLARTCCTSTLDSAKPLGYGDYIFDTKYSARNRVPRTHDKGKAQSDHMPVEAVLGP